MSLFPAAPGPRLFGLPPGEDFARTLVDGLAARLEGAPPEEWARVEIFVNTQRMRRRLLEVLAEGPARLLPRIRLITDLATDLTLADIPPPVAPLRRRLELTAAVARLLEVAPDAGPRAALFDLSDSLAALMDEMQAEGVHPETLIGLDTGSHAAHWARAQTFLKALLPYWADPAIPPDREARQRRAVEALAARWAVAPPEHPVLAAGSTGSRGATALLMRAVAALPQGALLLPGFDFDQPGAVWAALAAHPGREDHPQTRFLHLLRSLETGPEAVLPWHVGARDPARTARRALVSLALRPAPVTDQWLSEGPTLAEDLAAATEGLTLAQVPDPRREAQVIALRLRAAAEDGSRAALVTPDRTLARRVTAELGRWGIEPDDSSGAPLSLSPPGRLLRQVAAMVGMPAAPDRLIALLNHPLVAAGAQRGAHLLHAQAFDLYLRGKPLPAVDGVVLAAWVEKARGEAGGWAAWLDGCLSDLAAPGPADLGLQLERLLRVGEALVSGPEALGAEELWNKATGQACRALCDELAGASDAAAPMGAADLRAVLDTLLAARQAHDPLTPHPGVMIWGTLEARVQAADLIILAGLHEGIWPELPAQDPWLSRDMRARVGLLSPERRIGLAAHDFQQAVCGAEVMLVVARRDAEAPLVPSRWLKRLTSLLAGLGTPGQEALAAMEARGQGWLALADALDRPATEVPPAPRPAPRPPADLRPRRLSVTEVKTLIRDPYAIYARHVLGLQKLEPLRPTADARMRGILLHKVFERFVEATADALPPEDEAAALLLRIAQEVLADLPWPAERRLWLGGLRRGASEFLAAEALRRDRARPVALEQKGELTWQEPAFTLVGKADRIDLTQDGEVIIYDYKTGKSPSETQVRHFDKQLPLLALMALEGAFAGLDPVRGIAGLSHLRIGPVNEEKAVKPDAWDLDDLKPRMGGLFARYLDPGQGFTARRAMEKTTDASDYDHLSRFGEWAETDAPEPEDMA